jgi:hypothetical protein
VRKITTAVTPLEQMNPESVRAQRLAYGYLWWIFDDAVSRSGGPLQGAYTAEGTIGQYITVIPKLDLVVAHKTVPGSDRDVSNWDYLRFVDLLLAAACEPCSASNASVVSSNRRCCPNSAGNAIFDSPPQPRR